jgi:tetratricopeptide (TPR) repeat protein
LHDEILLKLQKISSLISLGRTSVLQYAQAPPSVREIAEALGVQFIGECTVQRTRNRIRVIFQLLDTQGAHVWAEDYDREFTLDNILDIQTEIAQQVAQTIGAALTPEERARVEARPTEDLDAYELYLLGRNRWTSRSPEMIREAIEYFEAAIESDSTFALALSGLADAYMLLPAYDLSVGSLDVYAQAKAAATRALDLDPSVGEAHASMGYIAFLYELDWEKTGRHLAAAVELAPGYPTAHHFYANLLASLGRFDDAVGEMETAFSLDPRSNVLAWASGALLWRAGRIEEARARYEQASATEPSIPWTLQWLAMTLGLDEPTDLVRAGELLAEFASHFGYPFPARMAVVAEAMTGTVEAQAAAVAVLDDLVDKTQLGRANLLWLYWCSAPSDVFFDVLEEAYRLRNLWIALFPSRSSSQGTVPEPFRDPRWEVFLNRIGHPGFVE